MDNIDFHLLMSGKICMDEVDRIKRLVRKDVLRFPTFMKNMAAYRRTLKKMLILNGLDQIHGPRSAPVIFTERLEERKKEGDFPSKSSCKKVRSKPSKVLLNCKFKSPATTKNSATCQKEKNIKTKSKDKMASLEVEMFPISNMFVNKFHLKLGERKQKEQEARTEKLEQSVRENIASLDCSLSERIEQLRSIVREHTWSNSDSSYRESLINEASYEVFETEKKFGTDIICEDKTLDCQDSDGITGHEKPVCINVTDRKADPKSILLDKLNKSLQFDFITSYGNALHDFDQPQEHNGLTVEDNKPVNNSLPDLKVFQRQNSETNRYKIQTKDGPASARSKLVSKRKVMSQMSVSSLTNSFELNDQSKNSEYFSSQASGDIGDTKIRLGKSELEDLNVLSAKESSHTADELNHSYHSCLFNSFNKGSAEMRVNRSTTEIFPNKKQWHNSHKRSCMMSLQREKCSTAKTLKPEVVSNQKDVAKTLTGFNNSLLTHHKTLYPDNTLVKFRMPKLTANVVNMKSLPPTDKNNNVANVLITQKTLLSKTIGSERQMARLKLDSLAKKKHNYGVDVPVMQLDSPSIMSQTITSNQCL